jgi:hypothetical protein
MQIEAPLTLQQSVRHVPGLRRAGIYDRAKVLDASRFEQREPVGFASLGGVPQELRRNCLHPSKRRNQCSVQKQMYV